MVHTRGGTQHTHGGHTAHTHMVWHTARTQGGTRHTHTESTWHTHTQDGTQGATRCTHDTWGGAHTGWHTAHTHTRCGTRHARRVALVTHMESTWHTHTGWHTARTHDTHTGWCTAHTRRGTRLTRVVHSAHTAWHTAHTGSARHTPRDGTQTACVEQMSGMLGEASSLEDGKGTVVPGSGPQRACRGVPATPRVCECRPRACVGRV